MTMHGSQFRTHIIRPAIVRLFKREPTDVEVELLALTCAAESLSGKYLTQEGGPALGFFQMEPRTHDDIWVNYLSGKSALSHAIHDVLPRYETRIPPASLMVSNLLYAAMMCRVHYLRVPSPLPAENNAYLLAEYWKRYYNTHLGAGTVEGAIEKYLEFGYGRKFGKGL